MDHILEKINTAALVLLEPTTLKDSYKAIVKEAIQLVGADEGLILLAFSESGKDILKTVYGSTKEATAYVPKINGYSYESYKKKKAFTLNAKEIKDFYPELEKLGIKSKLFIPLFRKNESVGALVVRSKKRSVAFTTKELNILKLYGSLSTLAIRKAQNYEEMKKALDVRDSFISLASHELRTPLTSISGYIQLLSAKMGKSETKEAGWVKELMSETNRLVSLIKELLEINKLKAGKLQFDWGICNIEEIVKDAIKKAESKTTDHTFLVLNTKKGNGLLVCDKNKLSQVFTTILDNIVKNAPPSTIKIQFLSTKDNINVVIEAKTKSGKTDLTKRMEGNMYKEGRGLGHLLAKHILEYHKAKLYTKSNDHSSTVEIVFPKTELE